MQFFSQAGPVVKARIGVDRETGRSRGFAFVEFETDDACANAIATLNNQEMSGRRLRVNDADDKPPPRAAGGPPPGGGFRQPGWAPRPAFGGRGGFPSEMPPPMDPGFGGGWDGGGGGGGGPGGDRPRVNNNKGSRRGIRARKRSLWG